MIVRVWTLLVHCCAVLYRGVEEHEPSALALIMLPVCCWLATLYTVSRTQTSTGDLRAHVPRSS